MKYFERVAELYYTIAGSVVLSCCIKIVSYR